MPSLAVRLTEIDDSELEQFIELWVEKKSEVYHRVERIGAANDKGRDVIGFLTSQRHEGAWHLYQCKRKTRGAKLGKSEALAELGKVFYHHVEGAYRTLPTKYVFVSPRGIVGPLLDLINNPTDLQSALIDGWDDHCAKAIVAKTVIPLSESIRKAIESYPFSRVEHLSAPMIVKDKAAGPALSKILGLVPDEAPPGVAPGTMQNEELIYVEQLRQVYEEASAESFATADDILRHADHGDHFRDQRTRFFEAAAFQRFHRDNTDADALVAFQEDIYHGVIDVHRQPHSNMLQRVDAVMRHASLLPTDLRGRSVRTPVRQGMCHHLVNDNRFKWTS
ncbi:hypothetical protein DevBK_07315 [Devosia sp. BK]|uniref:ABC-three component system protein n=1 Tax=Devosia sp. BK TaxID=2871706 RepID=UPI00293994C6|nr:ABC-three component system protein [Devosia sp. BK]MDV3251132.1 hypothetical protein [Devosia sp. BK]